MENVIIKITNGKKVYIENITDLVDGKDPDYYREIKIKEDELDSYRDHIINKWCSMFYEFDDLPEWLVRTRCLTFEVIHKSEE